MLNNVAIDMDNQQTFAFAHQPIIRSLERTTLSHEILLRNFKNLTNRNFLEKPQLFCTHLLELAQYKARTVKHLMLNKGITIFFVNFTPDQIAHKDFLKALEAFYKLGICPSNIAIEVTEQQYAEDVDAFYDHLNTARNLGHAIVVDDFGSGVSNFNHVKQLKPNIVKIDKAVLNGALVDTYNYKFLMHLVHFLKQIGTNVVIEGVETEAHLSVALKSRCDYMQGYYFARPVIVGSFEHAT